MIRYYLQKITLKCKILTTVQQLHKEQLHASKVIFVIRVTNFLRVGEVLSSSFKEFQIFGPQDLKVFSPYLVVIYHMVRPAGLCSVQ